jgi:general stress protein 26
MANDPGTEVPDEERPAGGPDVVYRFGHDTTAPKTARRQLRSMVGPGQFGDDVTLVASELVTNAIAHTDDGGQMRAWNAETVRLEVEDTSRVLPTTTAASETGGRGMPIVGSLSTDWGATSTDAGKVVWAEFQRPHDRVGHGDAVPVSPAAPDGSSASEQSDDDQQRSLESLLGPGTTCMVGTASGVDGALEFRPLTVARVDGSYVDVLLDTRERWVGEFTNGDVVHATLSDNRSNDWAHVAGTGTVLHDEALIDELWNPFAGAYFDDGRTTPGIAVFRLRVEQGRYWSTPSGRLGSVISMVAAALGRGSSGAEAGDVITG